MSSPMNKQLSTRFANMAILCAMDDGCMLRGELGNQCCRFKDQIALDG